MNKFPTRIFVAGPYLGKCQSWCGCVGRSHHNPRSLACACMQQDSETKLRVLLKALPNRPIACVCQSRLISPARSRNLFDFDARHLRIRSGYRHRYQCMESSSPRHANLLFASGWCTASRHRVVLHASSLQNPDLRAGDERRQGNPHRCRSRVFSWVNRYDEAQRARRGKLDLSVRRRSEFTIASFGPGEKLDCPYPTYIAMRMPFQIGRP